MCFLSGFFCSSIFPLPSPPSLTPSPLPSPQSPLLFSLLSSLSPLPLPSRSLLFFLFNSLFAPSLPSACLSCFCFGRTLAIQVITSKSNDTRVRRPLGLSLCCALRTRTTTKGLCLLLLDLVAHGSTQASLGCHTAESKPRGTGTGVNVRFFRVLAPSGIFLHSSIRLLLSREGADSFVTSFNWFTAVSLT